MRDNLPLIHRDARALGPIEQPLEMKSCEAILRLLADISRKGRNRTGILGLKQGVRVEIAFCRRVVELFFPQRFECSDHLSPAPQHKIADRPPAKILDSLGE